MDLAIEPRVVAAMQAIKPYMEYLPPDARRVFALGIAALEGGYPTVEEMAPFIGRHWYISRTGRKLKHRSSEETPITHKKYDQAVQAALDARAAP